MGTGTIEAAEAPLLSLEELRAQLRKVGEERYHHQHRFHPMMHNGELSRGQLQAWALNRYYYQSRIPIKDAIILSCSVDASFRRAWRKRMVDHDGDATSDGGIKRWLKLAEATGLDPQRVVQSCEGLPATRYAVNEYLNLSRTRLLLEVVASSLTELFSKDLIALRVDRLRRHYPWLSDGLDYFEARLHQAPEDAAAFTIQYAYENAKTKSGQEKVIQALRDKCDILWAQRPLFRLCAARLAAAWRFPGAGMKPLLTLDSSKPRLAEGCLWGGNGEERFLLLPEGAVRLQETGLKILELCDGRRTFSELVDELRKQYTASDVGRIREDAARFLERLRERRVVDY